MVIGRADGCDIVIKAKFISNRHCVLMFDGELWWVKDLDSTNGTDTKDQAAYELTPLPSGGTLILARRLHFVIEYIPEVERARFEGGKLGDSVLDVLDETRGNAEYGPATSRLTKHHHSAPIKKDT